MIKNSVHSVKTSTQKIISKNLCHLCDPWETIITAAALQTGYSFIHAVSAKRLFFENHFLDATALRSATAESNPIGWY
jgi:hypothetical protein